MRKTNAQSYLGKYREIILAVAFFLIFDLAVLVLNFYISYQISDSAINLNLSGRQRMLSQRMTKSLLIKQSDTEQFIVNPKNDEELKKTVTLFNTTLLSFEKGGEVMGTDEKKVRLKQLTDQKYKDILAKADHIWQPYTALLDPIIKGSPTTEQLDATVAYARANNLELLGLMNKLTTELEKDASQRANFLRYVQTGGIALATLNFLFILFKFIRRLRENDRLVEAAQQETAEILGTVREGLFLLDGDFKIGSQFSASLSDILGSPVSAGQDFRDELKRMVGPGAFEAALDYISLLLAGRVTESLVGDLNPLIAIPVQHQYTQDGAANIRYLTFLFNRVIVDGKVSHLLVSVFNVTEQQELEFALAEAKKQARSEVEVMLEILKVNPASLAEFLADTEQKLQGINTILKDTAEKNHQETINVVFRHIHTIKGEAGALGLGIFEDMAQQFEKTLASLREKKSISDNDLLALPGPLDEFFYKIGVIRELNSKLAAYGGNNRSPAAASQQDASVAESFAGNLSMLAHRIAKDHDKSISLTAELQTLETLPNSVQKEVKEIALQLIRNAVAHGVEQSHIRKARNKAPIGSIYIGLDKIEDHYELIVRDDGHGLIAEDIKQTLIAKGMYTETQLGELDHKQILMKIFEPGFSTATQIDRDAGQGVGMDIVKQKIGALGARLGISSQKYLYTMFSIRFQA